MKRGGSGFSEAPIAIPDHFGHRDRLRDRFELGPDALPDYELLELMLFRMMPRRDVKPLAKALIRRFGSLAEVLAAPTERLTEIDGVGPAIARDLKIYEVVAQRTARAKLEGRSLVASVEAVLDYCRTRSAFLDREEFRVLFLDKRNGLIADERLGVGTVDHAPVYPREVMRRALELSAANLILVHNHPSGDPTPSPEDVKLTLQIAALAATMSIAVHDHIIIGRQGHASLKSLRLF